MLAHQWMLSVAKILKTGQTIGFPMKEGMAIYEFKGIKKPKKPKIFIEHSNERQPK